MINANYIESMRELYEESFRLSENKKFYKNELSSLSWGIIELLGSITVTKMDSDSLDAATNTLLQSIHQDDETSCWNNRVFSCIANCLFIQPEIAIRLIPHFKANEFNEDQKDFLNFYISNHFKEYHPHNHYESLTMLILEAWSSTPAEKHFSTIFENQLSSVEKADKSVDVMIDIKKDILEIHKHIKIHNLSDETILKKIIEYARRNYRLQEILSTDRRYYKGLSSKSFVSYPTETQLQILSHVTDRYISEKLYSHELYRWYMKEQKKNPEIKSFLSDILTITNINLIDENELIRHIVNKSVDFLNKRQAFKILSAVITSHLTGKAKLAEIIVERANLDIMSQIDLYLEGYQDHINFCVSNQESNDAAIAQTYFSNFLRGQENKDIKPFFLSFEDIKGLSVKEGTFRCFDELYKILFSEKSTLVNGFNSNNIKIMFDEVFEEAAQIINNSSRDIFEENDLSLEACL